MIINKKSGRFGFRTNKRYNYFKSNNTNPNNKSRPRGNVSVLYSKYTKLAKEAATAGDRIQAEYYHQFADHYSRIMSENGIKSYGNENISTDSDKQSVEVSSSGNGEDSDNKAPDPNLESSVNSDVENENDDSLETVSFISQPVNKTPKIKK